MRNVYYSSKSVFQEPKAAVKKLLGLIYGGESIEIIARKS